MAPWTPLDLATPPRAFFSADDVAGVDGATVSTWTSKINGYSLTQGTAGFRPTKQTLELNGHTVVRFDGTDDFLSGGVFGLGAAPWTVAVVAKPTNVAAGDWIITNTNGGFGALTVYMTGSTLFRTYGGDAGNTIDVAHVAGNWIIGVARQNGASSALRKDGTQTTGTLVHGSIGSNTFVGSNRTGSGQYLAGDIAALIYCTGILSVADSELIEGWAAHE
jgi:hypothetical protein